MRVILFRERVNSGSGSRGNCRYCWQVGTRECVWCVCQRRGVVCKRSNLNVGINICILRSVSNRCEIMFSRYLDWNAQTADVSDYEYSPECLYVLLSSHINLCHH